MLMLQHLVYLVEKLNTEKQSGETKNLYQKQLSRIIDKVMLMLN